MITNPTDTLIEGLNLDAVTEAVIRERTKVLINSLLRGADAQRKLRAAKYEHLIDELKQEIRVLRNRGW
jgi:hypothetical protein